MNTQNNQPIDFVIIWVDGNDPEWRKEKSEYDSSIVTTANSEVRFRDWDNLQYWFRAVEKYAPWVNKIHFVTWGHLPSWLDTQNPKLNIVNHKDYIPKEYLPTFSSHTIELNLHRIEGLAEQFVYFNDDTFLNKPVVPQDFFKDGLPCDTAAVHCIYFADDSAGHFHGSDIEIINDNFNKRLCMKRDWKKWFNIKNGFKNVIRTALLFPWPWFPGMYCQHTPNSFLKSTFETVWDKAYDTLHETCQHKFRKKSDVNQWVMKYWQLAEGKFSVRDASFAQCYHIDNEMFNSLCKELDEKNHAMICINDTINTENFEEKKQIVIEKFQKNFPDKSSFEK